jgi:type III restriction enzyme
MKYTLTDYQEVAAADVLRGLRKSASDFAEDREYSADSLTAPTGAGKTVIATAVVERLFFGDGDAIANSGAVVLWITDDPSLNEQTKRKMLMA